MKVVRLGFVVALISFASFAYGNEYNVETNVGYRNDSLRWNIASDSTGSATPNILSELTWHSLNILQFGIRGEMTAPNGFHLRGSAAYGSILDGRNQDSDYAGDNRTFEFSRSTNDSNGDNTSDFSAAIGYRFQYAPWGADRFTALFGLSRNLQNLRITNGNQVIPATGPFPGLNSTYQTEWSSNWLGLEVDSQAYETARAFFRLEYHRADYSAEANWNLRSDFMHPRSFEHKADGKGWVLSFGAYGTPEPGRWTSKFTFDYQIWKTDPGTDETFFTDGTTSTTRLNEVKWTSWAISVGLQRIF